MAKSIRSKWRRKCRAVKRVRYGEKELERLKKTLTNDPLNKVKTEAVMTEIQEVANVITIEDIEAETVATPAAGPSDLMDMEEIKREFNPRTLRDKHGAYPVWVHPRKLKSTKKNKKNNKNKKKVKRNNKKK